MKESVPTPKYNAHHQNKTKGQREMGVDEMHYYRLHEKSSVLLSV